MLFLDPEPWFRNDNRWRTSPHRHRKPVQVLKSRGRARARPGRPSQAPRGCPPRPQDHTRPLRLWCTACHWLELLPGQACCLKPLCRMSPELPPLCPEPGPRLPRKLRFGTHSLHQQGGAAPTPDAGHALLDSNTPPFPRAQRHTPRPAAKQQAGRIVRVRTRSWNSRPVATQYSEHNWRRLCNCPAREAGRAGRALPSSHHSSR